MKNKDNESNKNLTVTHEVVSDGYKTYVSEVQTFKVPEDYEDAFKKYYPKE